MTSAEGAKIKAVFFDIGGVLATKILGRMADDLADKYGRGKKEFNEKIHIGWGDYKIGKIDAGNFWQLFIDSAGLNESPSELAELSLKYIEELPGVMDIVKELKEKYKLGILSNNVEEWMQYLRKIMDLEVFDVVISSHEAGMKKPLKEFFMLGLEKMGGIKPEECVFIDDQDNNIDAAKEIGFVAVKFENAEKLRKDLEELGVI